MAGSTGVVAHPPTKKLKKGELPPIPPGLARVTVKVVLAPRTPPAPDEPIPDAIVEITGQFKGNTDKNGEVITHAFTPGTFQLLVFKTGFGPVPNFDSDPFVKDVNLVDGSFQVVAGENFVVKELSDGTGVLTVRVFKLDNSAIPDCDVTVVGSGTINTKTTGETVFRRVPGGKKDIKARKVGFGPNVTPFAFGDGKPDVDVIVPAGRKKDARVFLTSETTRVQRIAATLPATKTLRSPAISPVLAANTLANSTVDVEDLALNPPVILVRGCTKVELVADTVVAGKPVDWAVKPNQNTESAPVITPKNGGKNAELDTNKTGSFSVIAAVGDSRRVWNVVFVFVDVKVNTSLIVGRNTGYVDSGSSAGVTQFRSGQFIFGQQAMEATVDIELTGGGTAKDIGLKPIVALGNFLQVGKMNLHILQMGAQETLQGIYPGTPNGTGSEVPAASVPILDSNGPNFVPPAKTTVISSAPSGGVATSFTTTASPFVIASSSFQLTKLSDRKFRIKTGDSPAGSFRRNHPNPAKARLASVQGMNGFRTAVASASQDAVNSVVVHAEFAWQAIFDGSVNYPSAAVGVIGTYAKTTARTSVPARYALLSATTGGTDARSAPYDIFEPRFNNGLTTSFA